ncbi:MAG: asparagine synthase C-terminal domain-containing protein [Actinomycetota bacterium]|nr:asparagine synthase C-terminal domain-containing protein [Actinomycetota bacterium]
MVAEWLAGAPATIDETLWAGIRNVPGGRRLVSSHRGAPRVSRYWNPAEESEEPINNLADAADAMRSAVTDAVRAHLRCIDTPEIELSGGWDSSTVAVVANELHAAGAGPDFRLSSVVYPDDPPLDESPYIEAMERHLGRASLKRPLHLAPFEILMDEGRETRHPSRRDDWRAIEVSAAHRVTMTGDGGNETLGGMWPSGPALLADALLTRGPDGARPRELLAQTLRRHVRPSLPIPLRMLRSPPLGLWLDRDFSRRVSLARRFAVAEPATRFTTLRRIAALSWLNGWGMQQSDLNTELDRGRYVELRQPLLDVRLVRLALRLPARVMGTPYTDARHLHRHAFGSSLPALVTARTWGTEFTSLRVLELQRLVDGLGEPRRLASAGWLDAAAARDLIDSALLGASVHWRASLLYAVELWMKSESHR